MATRKVDRLILWQTAQAGIVLSSTSKSTAGKTLTARLYSEANAPTGASGVSVGTAAGAVAGTDITVPLDLTTNGITAGNWYSLRIFSDLNGASEMGVLPNSDTADEILVYVKPAS